MDLNAYFSARRSGMALIAAAAGRTVAQLRAAGAGQREAQRLAELARVYHGRTTHHQIQQRLRQEGAHHSLEALELIESFARRLDHQKAWKLRQELVPLRASEDRLEELGRQAVRKKDAPASGVRLRQRGGGISSLTYTGASSLIVDLHKRLPGLKQVEAFLDGAETGRGSAGGQRTVPVTQVVMRLEDLQVTGTAGEDVLLTCTDGAQLTGAEYVKRRLETVGLITLVDPVHGPVNLYRAQRHASVKQTLMARSLYPTCASPGCRVPAERCQMHHIVAWRMQGPTNTANLVPLCAFHNGKNDDDPHAPPHWGRVDGQAGALYFTYPSGYQVPVPSSLDDP